MNPSTTLHVHGFTLDVTKLAHLFEVDRNERPEDFALTTDDIIMSMTIAIDWLEEQGYTEFLESCTDGDLDELLTNLHVWWNGVTKEECDKAIQQMKWENFADDSAFGYTVGEDTYRRPNEILGFEGGEPPVDDR